MTHPDRPTKPKPKPNPSPKPASGTLRPVAGEAAVLAACLKLLKLRRVPAWRNNSGMFPGFGAGGRKRPVRAGLGTGSADIVGILGGPFLGDVPSAGRLLAVEIKRPGERPTAAQVAWLRAVNAAGGLAFWVDDVAELARVLDIVGAGARAGLPLRVLIADDGSQRMGGGTGWPGDQGGDRGVGRIAVK
jgi:hypothetical protein